MKRRIAAMKKGYQLHFWGLLAAWMLISGLETFWK
jgi:hypothetical protein